MGAASRDAGGVAAALLLRDNLRNRRTIEREYLYALGAARHDVIIANAYFLPGTKMRRALLAGLIVQMTLDSIIWTALGLFLIGAVLAPPRGAAA